MEDALAGLRAALAPHNGHARDPEVIAKRFGLGKGGLTPRQWERINAAIGAWRDRVLASARHMPHQAYAVGHGQTTRFLRLLGTTDPGPGPAPDKATAEWLQWLLEHELTGTLDRYTDEIRSAVLYGMENTENPVAVAAALHKATEAADRDWRLVAQSEMARANAMGRLAGSIDMGYDEVWIPPHTGACQACKDLIENRVFPAELLQKNVTANYGRKAREWVPALPLHPRCRHTALPYVAELYHEAQQEYLRLQEHGLSEAAIDEMYDSSGQLRPQFARDPRLAALGKSMSASLSPKTPGNTGVLAIYGEDMSLPMGVYEAALATAVAKVRSDGHVSKGFFDPPQVGLDPLIWDDLQLRPDVRAAILDFWTGVLGTGWQAWAKVFITGSATSYQWGTGWQHPWLGSSQRQTFPDVDTHLVIDYAGVRDARPLWAGMTPMELRKLIESWAKKAKENVEVAPGLRLDAYVRLETTEAEFERDVEKTGQGVYDVAGDRWLIEPQHPVVGEFIGARRILGGVGGRLAHENPDWIAAADAASAELQRLLDAYQQMPGPATLGPLQAYMDALYEARTAGFLEGNGQEDRGNFIWAYLGSYGPLLDVKELLAAMPVV